MNDYRPLTIAAGNVRSDEQTLLEFSRSGWIKVVVKDQNSFVSGQDEYRSRFILHLRQELKLSDEQIAIVLDHEKPPYSVKQVPAILARHSELES
jgi:hypothetical protein